MMENIKFVYHNKLYLLNFDEENIFVYHENGVPYLKTTLDDLIHEDTTLSRLIINIYKMSIS